MGSLIFGWGVSYYALNEWAIKNGIDKEEIENENLEWYIKNKIDMSTYQDKDLLEIIQDDLKLPTNWKLIETKPWDDRNYSEEKYDIRYYLMSGFRDGFTLSELTEICNSSNFTEAMTLARELGCEDEATIYSVPYVSKQLSDTGYII